MMNSKGRGHRRGKHKGGKKRCSETSPTKEHLPYSEHSEPRLVAGWQYHTYIRGSGGDRYSYIGTKDEDTGEPEFLDYGPKGGWSFSSSKVTTCARYSNKIADGRHGNRISSKSKCLHYSRNSGIPDHDHHHAIGAASPPPTLLPPHEQEEEYEEHTHTESLVYQERFGMEGSAEYEKRFLEDQQPFFQHAEPVEYLAGNHVRETSYASGDPQREEEPHRGQAHHQKEVHYGDQEIFEYPEGYGQEQGDFYQQADDGFQHDHYDAGSSHSPGGYVDDYDDDVAGYSYEDSGFDFHDGCDDGGYDDYDY